MRNLRILYYTLIQSFENLKKNVLMIFSSIYVVFVTLLIIGALSLVSMNFQNELKNYTDKPEIRIDCASEISNDDALKLMRKIEAYPDVKDITFISKEENLSKFYDLIGEDADIFRDYSNGADAFYVSFDVKLKNSSSAKDFVDSMFKVDGVEYVKDNISVVKTFEKVQNIIKISTLVSVIVLGTLSVFLASNTIRLTVETRKKSIEIEKCVGASVFYIEGPFVIEGIVIGVVGAVLSFLSLNAIYNVLANKFTKSGSTIMSFMPFSQAGNNFFILFIVFGVAVGVIASLVAIKKYDKD